MCQEQAILKENPAACSNRRLSEADKRVDQYPVIPMYPVKKSWVLLAQAPNMGLANELIPVTEVDVPVTF